jgi:hypothetical protein
MEETVNIFLLWILTGIPNYQQYIKDVPGLDRYPNAAAINVLTEVTVDIQDDTTYTYDVFYIKKILTYKGKIRYSDVDLLYNADHETVELGECFTVDPDGKKVVVPSEAFHDQEHYLTLSSPEYVNIRQKTVNFPGVEPGYFVVVHYSRTNKRREFVDGVEHMMEANPYLLFSVLPVQRMSGCLQHGDLGGDGRLFLRETEERDQGKQRDCAEKQEDNQGSEIPRGQVVQDIRLYCEHLH